MIASFHAPSTDFRGMRRIFFQRSGKLESLDKKLLAKHPFLKDLPSVRTVIYYTNNWMIAPKELKRLTYKGQKLYIGNDGRVGLTPDEVHPKPGQIIRAGYNELWVRDLDDLDGTATPEREVARLCEIPPYHQRQKVWVDGKRTSRKYILDAEWKKFPTLDTQKNRKAAFLARWGLTDLPAKWDRHTDAEWKTHFELQRQLAAGEIVEGDHTDIGGLNGLENRGSWALQWYPEVERKYDPIANAMYGPPSLDPSIVLTAFDTCLEQCYGRETLVTILYAYNQLGGKEFSERIAGLLHTKYGLDFHMLIPDRKK